MEDRESTELTSRQAEYRGYVISSTALTNGRGQWLPCVTVTLPGRRIGLSRERPDRAHLTREAAICQALAWGIRLIDEREVPVSEIGNVLLTGKR
ncbi:DUF6566 family protein [Paraburkholderia strydomiana]|uniref:DUF6566 family protein n=1 Tax=Paraburkholderia strydomiana TaxID=1245417 RepID=UPI0028607902|nr:hypothetical protein [Paraburkholderia strydomiana]